MVITYNFFKNKQQLDSLCRQNDHICLLYKKDNLKLF